MSPGALCSRHERLLKCIGLLNLERERDHLKVRFKRKERLQRQRERDREFLGCPTSQVHPWIATIFLWLSTCPISPTGKQERQTVLSPDLFNFNLSCEKSPWGTPSKSFTISRIMAWISRCLQDYKGHLYYIGPAPVSPTHLASKEGGHGQELQVASLFYILQWEATEMTR